MNAIKKRNLSELLSGIKDAPSTKITGICDDSRNIKKGDVFFAFQGDISHGMDYLEIVIEAGAAAIIYELPYANITENNLIEMAETGVNFISMGALTYSAKPIDLSLKAVLN